MSEDTEVLVGAAWQDLAAGRWPQARATFERVLEREQVAEALHGLAEALLWLGETDAAVQHYERAHASFRRRPDPALAGLCALALYFAHRVSLGNAAASRGWLGRLARLVDEHDLGPLKGWVALAHDREGAAAAGELAREALALARAAGDVDLELCALSQLGAVLVERGRVEEGVAPLDEALTASLAGEATSLDTVVLTSCLMIQCCSQRRTSSAPPNGCGCRTSSRRATGCRTSTRRAGCTSAACSPPPAAGRPPTASSGVRCTARARVSRG